MLIAVTGGIGSGKSYVCRRLEQLGIRVYDCDFAAKRLMRESVELQRRLTETVGEEVFPDGRLDKALLSRFIVGSEENTQKVNAVVHPAVATDLVGSGMEWFESAILFESGFATRVHIDYIVCVVAPLDVRIRRIIERDGISREKALGWIGRQMPQEEKAERSDFIIVNDGESSLDAQINRLLKEVNNKIKYNNN